MSTNKVDWNDLFGSSDDENTKPKPTKTVRPSIDNDEDFFSTSKDTAKATTNINASRKNDHFDDFDDDNGFNQTGGSTLSYTPKFGLDTIQRIVNQPRPGTASTAKEFDNLFSGLPTNVSASFDTSKPQKSVRFDDTNTNYTRPLTAPAPNARIDQSNISTISAMRTGLEPRQSFDQHTSTKPSADTEKVHDWLESRDISNDSDDRPGPGRLDSVITTIVKSTPTAPASQTPTKQTEPAKKNLLDNLLDDDRRELQNPTAKKPPVPSNDKTSDLRFNPQEIFNRRPAPSDSVKTSFDANADHDLDLFKDTTKDSLFKKDQTISSVTRSSSSNADLEVKRLVFENNELRMTIDHMKRQHETEIQMMKENYQYRLEYVETSCERREARLKEENEHLLRQLNDRTQQYDKEKNGLLIEHQRRFDELQRDRTTEIENLRALQKQTVDHLRREHEETIRRLKQLKQEEVSTALDVTTHTRAFESVVDHMEQNMKNIDELRLKVEAKHNAVLTDKQIEARTKEQQLKAYEERLQMQANDFERERKNLQELISRLEVHLSEQTKLVEEERWKALQSQKRMEAMQEALNSEQRLFMDKMSREKMDIQRSKDQLLEDQKIALANIFESRSQLADERAKVDALQKAFQEQKHRDMLQNATIEAETRTQQKLAAEQRLRLEKREEDLVRREEALMLEKRSLTELKQRLELEQSTFKTESQELKHRAANVEHENELIKKERERLSHLYFELHELDSKSTGRLQQLQRSINSLRQQEEQMHQHFPRTTADRSNSDNVRSSITFSKHAPIKDTGFSTIKLAAAAATPILPINSTQQSIEEGSVLRALRMNALQDQLYIQDEMSFLDSIRSGNHRSSRSASFSNIHRPSESNLLKTNN